MPLLINGKPITYVKDTIQSLTDDIEWQKEAISSFERSACKHVALSQSSLIILQGECASINMKQFDCLGTPFATTCNILFILNKGGTKIACAHLDGGLKKKQLVQVFDLFDKTELHQEGVHAYIIGGYLDEKDNSMEVTDTILRLICKERAFKNYNIHLSLLYTAQLNTNYKMIKDEKQKDGKLMKVALPKYQNVAYNLKQQAFICFDIKAQNIPYNTLRSAVGFDKSKKVKIRIVYDCCNAKDVKNGPKIERFDWMCPDWIRNVIAYQMSDDKILQYFSTSPYAEHDEFAKDSMALFKFLANNSGKQVFNGKPVYLKCGVILDKMQNVEQTCDDLEEKKSPK
eukprot:52820_1